MQLLIENLSKSFETKLVLDKVSITLDQGVIYALLGRKGGMYKFVGSLISYTNILIIPFIIGNLDVGINKLFVVLLVIMLIMVLIFPLIVKKYGKKTFKIRK